MSKDSDNSLEKLIQYIQNWLKINEENQKAVRPLTDILEVLLWAKETIEEMPESLKTSFDQSSFYSYIGKSHQMIAQYAPPMQPVNLDYIKGSAVTATGVASVTLFGLSSSVSNDKEKLWADRRYSAFIGIQERQKAIERVRILIKKLQSGNNVHPDIVQEYDLMIEKAFYFRGSEIDKTISAGISMRNLHEHYKGKLFNLARTNPRENMTWQIMVERLCNRSKGTVEYELQLNGGENWSTIQELLSDIAKNKNQIEIKQSAIRLITHLNTVLTLVSL